MTREDLDQLDQLIQKRLEENNKQLRQQVKQDISAAVDPLHERLDAQRDQTNSVAKELSTQISREAKDLAGIITDGIFPKLVTHDQQIRELQEEVGIKPRKH